MFRLLSFLAMLGGCAALAATLPKATVHPQQLVYQSLGSLTDGTRVGIFVPSIPIALGLQSKNGPRVLTIGDILRCTPYDEEVEMYRKGLDGSFERSNGHQELLNCGPMIPGGPDRVLTVVGIAWQQ